jgi:hypothetical protein
MESRASCILAKHSTTDYTSRLSLKKKVAKIDIKFTILGWGHGSEVEY